MRSGEPQTPNQAIRQAGGAWRLAGTGFTKPYRLLSLLVRRTKPNLDLVGISTVGGCAAPLKKLLQEPT